MRTIATLLLLGSLALAGCEFAAGAATGALATGAGYTRLTQSDRWTGSKMTIAVSESAVASMNAAKIR